MSSFLPGALLEVTHFLPTFREVLLVIVLGTIERARWNDLCRDRPGVALFLRDAILGHTRKTFLFRRVKENSGAILLAEVGALAVHLRGIMVGPEHVEQVVVAHLGGIELNLHRFGVTSRVGADVFVSRILRVTADVT